ncbi:MAG: flippase-like domain-containing protein [Myxococcales bacterium]|nr:flippase-like domain-containing protein [Myxococcales bacterium]
MEPSTRQRLVTLGKGLATVVVLGLVLRKVPLRDLAARMRALSLADLLALLALTTAQVTVGVFRWQRLLKRLGERVAFLPLYGDVLVGLMYNMFLPTTVGGDVVRALRCRARVQQGHAAWSSSLFERIAGLLAMAASGAIAAGVGLGSDARIPSSIRLLAGGLALGLLIAFFFAAAPFRILVTRLERSLPSVADDVRGIAADLSGPLATRGARFEALFWSLLYQALGIAFVIVGARALGAPGHALAIVVGVPIVHVLSMVPITIGGLGLREGLFVAILGPLGVAPAVALGLAAQWLASSVGFAIVGAGVALTDGKRG